MVRQWKLVKFNSYAAPLTLYYGSVCSSVNTSMSHHDGCWSNAAVQVKQLSQLISLSDIATSCYQILQSITTQMIYIDVWYLAQLRSLAGAALTVHSLTASSYQCVTCHGTTSVENVLKRQSSQDAWIFATKVLYHHAGHLHDHFLSRKWGTLRTS